ncbi:hypothetical protein [Pseudomonas orientalis]|uniref:hypothetical protein n=1 Tax=Pseudomonas orientalis TaxID=76758 RepID=UPI000F5833CD|nr:hypothetical protein [Pseudomonas orientalis]
MKILKSISAAWRNRSKKTLADLNDLALAFIGGPSFLIGTISLWSAGKFTSELFDISQTYGLPIEAILSMLLLGCLAASSWLFLTVARRCNDLLYKRNF